MRENRCVKQKKYMDKSKRELAQYMKKTSVSVLAFEACCREAGVPFSQGERFILAQILEEKERIAVSPRWGP